MSYSFIAKDSQHSGQSIFTRTDGTYCFHKITGPNPLLVNIFNGTSFGSDIASISNGGTLGDFIVCKDAKIFSSSVAFGCPSSNLIVRAIRFNGTSFSIISTVTETINLGTSTYPICFDGTYLYVYVINTTIGPIREIRVYSFNGVALSYVTKLNLVSSPLTPTIPLVRPDSSRFFVIYGIHSDVGYNINSYYYNGSAVVSAGTVPTAQIVDSGFSLKHIYISSNISPQRVIAQWYKDNSTLVYIDLLNYSGSAFSTVSQIRPYIPVANAFDCVEYSPTNFHLNIGGRIVSYTINTSFTYLNDDPMVNGNAITVDTLSSLPNNIVAGRSDSQNAYNFITIPPTPPFSMRYDNITVVPHQDGSRHFYYKDTVTNKKRFTEYIPE